MNGDQTIELTDVPVSLAGFPIYVDDNGYYCIGPNALHVKVIKVGDEFVFAAGGSYLNACAGALTLAMQNGLTGKFTPRGPALINGQHVLPHVPAYIGLNNVAKLTEYTIGSIKELKAKYGVKAWGNSLGNMSIKCPYTGEIKNFFNVGKAAIYLDEMEKKAT